MPLFPQERGAYEEIAYCTVRGISNWTMVPQYIPARNGLQTKVIHQPPVKSINVQQTL